MKDHKFQLIRIGVGPRELRSAIPVRPIGYRRIRGIFVALPDPILEYGATLSLKVGGVMYSTTITMSVTDLRAGVAPNQKFFLFEEYIEASGNAFEGRFRDAGIQGATYPYEAKVFLWLVNEQES